MSIIFFSVKRRTERTENRGMASLAKKPTICAWAGVHGRPIPAGAQEFNINGLVL